MSDTPVVLINVYRCEPEKQAALMDHLAAVVRAQRGRDGFVSATLHRGLNGRVAAVYGVWRSREDWKAMARHPEVAAAMEPVLAAATFEPHLYEPVEVA
ncbi:antibiotic biosynthesis monooxygenase family protein [Brevundimonas viscosa]|uniref:Quinol monooxygenase YgiN n=1 Tax=Brevundimonas viscosa TaxID=871741 RepID=A0A1I6QDR2_9CAUL|nr:antibiotic biosynthesis monooxygenase family protein [Brevundimonas viscosa]SFS50485.1 Quinol monooxygenase YgiN [Brevundimonas viscosa]